jgi:hypothetical protein
MYWVACSLTGESFSSRRIELVDGLGEYINYLQFRLAGLWFGEQQQANPGV